MTQINKKSMIAKISFIKKNSVKSSNLCQSVIQTSYDILKAHGGEIRVDKEAGRGAVFLIVLPVQV
jgi:signal transduction histidine kinase